MRKTGLFPHLEQVVRAADLDKIEERIVKGASPSVIRNMSELECAMFYLVSVAKKHWQIPRKESWLENWQTEERRVLQIVGTVAARPGSINQPSDNFPNGFALFYAVNAGSLALVRCCLARGAVLLYDMQGNTALDHALISLAESPGGCAPEIFPIIAELLLAGGQAKQAARMLPWYRNDIGLAICKIAESEPKKVYRFLCAHFERSGQPSNLIIFAASFPVDSLFRGNDILHNLYMKLSMQFSPQFSA